MIGQHTKNGFIMLSAALVLSAIFLSVAVGVASRALFGLAVRDDMPGGLEAASMANACLHEALFEFERSLDTLSGLSLTLAEGTCEVTLMEATGEGSYTISIVGTRGGYTYRLRAVVAIGDTRPVVSSKEQLTDL